MKPLFLLLALLAAAAVLILLACRGDKNKGQPGHERIHVCIIVKDQESCIEGFVRKLFMVLRDTTRLTVYILDDCSCDRTAEILHRLGRRYPLQVLSPAENGGINNCGGAAEPVPASALRFDVRRLRGKELLNAPLFCHLSHLNEGKSQVLSK